MFIRSNLILWLKLLLIAIVLLLAWPDVASRVSSIGMNSGLIAYAGLFAVTAIGMVAAALIQKHWLRALFAVFFGACAGFVDAFQASTGDFMTYDAFVNMIHSAGFIGDALVQQQQPILWATLKAVTLALAIALPPGIRLPKLLAPSTVILSVAALPMLLFVRGGDGATGLPSAYVGSSYSALYLFENATNELGERRPVELIATPSKADGDIVLIVDESIAGQYLDINNVNGVYSGLAEQVPGASIYNFGLAAAITNCSIGTNLTLRFGGTRSDYQRINATMPSIWSYAKAASYKTVYVDAQRTVGEFQNQMDVKERADIDRWIQFDDVAVRDRDQAAADVLAELLNDGQRQFILVNKMGAHFPVHDKYPDEYMTYQPALHRGQFQNIADTGERFDMDDGAEGWARYRNSYRNTIGWNVGSFFDRLLKSAKIGNSTIIYTADHGQALHERGQRGQATHCTPSAEMEEGVVPLVVITGPGERSKVWANAAKLSFNKMSHYRIWPTILPLMGYDAKAVQAIYGEPLTSNAADPFTFNTLFNARLGKEPKWKKIDVGKIASPPASDFKPLP